MESNRGSLFQVPNDFFCLLLPLSARPSPRKKKKPPPPHPPPVAPEYRFPTTKPTGHVAPTPPLLNPATHGRKEEGVAFFPGPPPFLPTAGRTAPKTSPTARAPFAYFQGRKESLSLLGKKGRRLGGGRNGSPAAEAGGGRGDDGGGCMRWLRSRRLGWWGVGGEKGVSRQSQEG